MICYRKKVRAAVGSCFPDLSQDDLMQIIPAKDDMTITKIYTHAGENVVIYSVQKVPVVFEVDRHILPTVYTLWKYHTMMTTFTTYPQLLEKFLNGAGQNLFLSIFACALIYFHTYKMFLPIINVTPNKINLQI